MTRRQSFLIVPLTVALLHCSGESEQRGDGTAQGGGSGMAGAGPNGGFSGGGAAGSAGSASGGASAGSCSSTSTGSVDVSVNAASRSVREGVWSVGYWTWAPSFGDPLAGTEDLLAALAPPVIRIGGYNNDANLPDPFDEAELDDAAAYAAATGSELLWQLPLLATPTGARPTADDIARLVTYANVTQGHAIPYVSIGNEPDLYPDMGGLSDPSAPAVAGYTPEQYCAEVAPLVAAVRQVDPAIEVVGPDLGYKYQDFADWLTPILEGCGELFDRIAIHRYPFESLVATTDAAYQDVDAFRNLIADVRRRMESAGVSDKPLGVTEANLAYIASPTGNPQGSILGTVPHALWIADFVNTAAELGLWIASIYDIADQDEWKLGLVGAPPEHPLRPAYHALALAATPTGSTALAVDTSVPLLRAYATLDAEDSRIHLVLVHWGTEPKTITLRTDGLDIVAPAYRVSLPALSVNDVSFPVGGTPSARTYGETEYASGIPPAPLAVVCAE